MTCYYPDLGSISDWSYRVGNFLQPTWSTTEIWVVTRHQYEISAVVSQTSFRRGEISAGRREMSASFSSLLASSLGHSGGGAMDGYLLFVKYLHEKKNAYIKKRAEK